MPIFALDTNIKRSAAKKDVKPLLANKIAEILGIDPKLMCISIRFDQDVSFADHNGNEPCGNAKVDEIIGYFFEIFCGKQLFCLKACMLLHKINLFC